MTSLNEMTKKNLLDLAKEYEVTGHHDMSKEDLVAALEEAGYEDEEEEEPQVEVASKEQLVNMKRRKPSSKPRDDSGRVIRKSSNLSGNVPFQEKLYALDEALANEKKWSPEYKAAIEAAPSQVRLILKYMREHQVFEGSEARGGEIAGQAIALGYVKTTIAPANLFAYYRRLLEALGVYLVSEG